MKYSKEQVYAQLMRYECKRSSREEVCADMGMSAGSFWYWLRKYRNDVNESVSFVELDDEDQMDSTLEIFLGDGRIMIQGEIDVELVRKLVGAESI